MKHNSDIMWHITTNFGRFLKASDRGSNRRKVLATIIRKARKTGVTADIFQACVWADALVSD